MLDAYLRLPTSEGGLGFSPCLSEPCLYTRGTAGTPDWVAILLYVDDLLLVGADPPLIDQLTHTISDRFRMTDLGLAQRYLGLQFVRTATTLLVHQSDYIRTMVSRFGMEDAVPIHSPMAVKEESRPIPL